MKRRIAARRRARLNPTEPLLVRRLVDGSKTLSLPVGKLWLGGRLERHQYMNKLQVTVVVWRGNFHEFSASGKLDDKTGGVHWEGYFPARMLDEYGVMIDRMVEWLLDPSMPPAGVSEATYDVEI